MNLRRSSPTPFRSLRRAFTLVEMLVVIGIIVMLLAILFPVLKGVQQRGQQATCVSNLAQVYLAVRLYKDDEREYPASLSALLPSTELLRRTSVAPGDTSTTNDEGTGYFRKSREILVCPSDDTQSDGDASTSAPRSSYGDLTDDALKKASYEVAPNAYNARQADFYTPDQMPDWGRLGWNFWGLDERGVAFRSESEMLASLSLLANGGTDAVTGTSVAASPASVKKMLRDGEKTPRGIVASRYLLGASNIYCNPRGLILNGSISEEDPREANPLNYSLSNPHAPDGTIITHCTFHRLPTAQNLLGPNPRELYASPADANGARDVILRLDGSARTYDVTRWNARDFPNANHGSNWQISDF